MKIGLVTYHHSNNVGAMLQTYATCRALSQLGHQVVIVDIRQTEKRKEGLVGVASDIIFLKRNMDYRRFRSRFYPDMTKRYYTIEELRKEPPMVDCLVVGSDQTWNPIISKDVALAYFLDFGSKEIKRFSYASSFGMENWDLPVSLTEAVKDAIIGFDSISVREKTGKRICETTFGREAQIVVDPTLLFDDYSEIAGPIINQNNEMLCYKLQRNADFFSNIGKCKDIVRCPIRLLNNAYPVKGLVYTYPPSIENWIKRIGGAKFVLTDSFHGVVFSILYKRQFAVIRCHDGRDSRFEDLLNAVGIENRVFDNMTEMLGSGCFNDIIDYTTVMQKLKILKDNSWDYLIKALQ